MISWLTQFGEWISNAFHTVGELLMSVMRGLMAMFKLFPKITTMVTDMVHYMPPVFVGFITITLIIVLAYLIINRDPGDT